MIDWISSHIPPWVWIALIVHVAVLGTVAYLILLERKVASWVQDRIGPNRVGLGFGILPVLKDMKMWGLGQPLADGLKFLLKEDYRPKGVDAILFTIAPCIMMAVIIISVAVIPWGGVKQTTVAAGASIPTWATPVDGQPNVYRWDFQIANLNIGVLYVIAVLSLAVYGIVIGGWASNNKFSFLGGLRATANMISYEIPMGLSILCIVLMFGTLDLGELVSRQAHYWVGFIPAWNVFTQPLAFLLFLICIHAEANRAPFDLAEAEQELVGGYHTEYSSMRFALFFLAEYAGMITTSCVCVALFFGGWHLPGLGGNVDPSNPAVTDSLIVCILRAGVFFAKTIAIIFVFMWVRWSLPRFRFDQLMDIAWRALIPISLALTVMTAVMVWWTGGQTLYGARARHALAFLGMNIAVVLATMVISRLLPAQAPTNRRLRVSGSRFNRLAPRRRGELEMKDTDIITLEEPKLSAMDEFYLPQVLKGLGTTMKHMLNVVVGGKDRVIQYPEERREDLPVEQGGMLQITYRGVHRLNKDEDGRVKCVACFMCSTACPAHCIHIEAETAPWQDREKYPAKFDIDELRCIYCGMCEEACPVDAIELTSLYDIVGMTRAEMIFDKEKLLRVYDETVKSEPM